jgi:hypothetical protein
MSDVVVESENPYARMLYWEVWNFMSIEHGKCEFDERNIINLKGYNDSGKSAMLNALKVLLYNANSTKQVSFIQDDKEYFRVFAVFADGVQILRDKYINGQSLYEMYKDGQLLYTSKNGNALTRITEVPQPIADYLGLIMYDNTCLNARACFEKQIGVQTTGSENYKMFNTVLKSEEIATAGALLNNDKNKLSSDIEATDMELQAQKRLLGNSEKLTEDMITYLKDHDASLDNAERKEATLSNINSLLYTLSSIPIYPEVEQVDLSKLNSLYQIAEISQKLSGVVVTPEISILDTKQLEELNTINNIINSLSSLKVLPEVPSVDGDRLSSLNNLVNLVTSLNNTPIAPEVTLVDNERLNTLSTIQQMASNLEFYNAEIEDNDKRLNALIAELQELQVEVANHGVKMVKCPGCGQIFNPEEAHMH